MTHLAWNAESGELRFRTESLEGTLRADGTRHAVTQLIHRPTGVRVDRDMLLAIYRLLSRSAWMGEARVMSHTVRPTEDGIELAWMPRLAHQVLLSARFAIHEPDYIDCTIGVVGHAYYPDYEVFVSNYFARSFRSGGYVGPARGEEMKASIQVQPQGSPIFREMYITFPRDEQSAHLITDGRWQRGRHFTRFLPARYYGLPLGFYSQTEGPLDVLLMGLPCDTFAVSMAYATDDPSDNVGQHNSFYLSLFGKDLHPGERWQTTVRLVVGAFSRDPRQHSAQYEKFLADHDAQSGSLEIEDLSVVQGT